MIFLSYSREDSERAARIYSLLVKPNRPVFYDKQSLVPGMDWKEEIEKAIDQCVLIIVLCTQHSVQKEGFIQKEILLAVDRSKMMPEGRIFIVPVRFDDVQVPRSLSRYQWLNIEDDKGFDDLEYFIELLWENIGRPINTGDKLEPSILDREHHRTKAILLCQGKNLLGEQIYSYLEFELWRFSQLRDHMAAGNDFNPKEFGRVLASGKGNPSPELKERMDREYNMIDMGPGTEEERRRRREMQKDFIRGFREAFVASGGKSTEIPAIPVPEEVPHDSNGFREGIRAALAARHPVRPTPKSK